LPSAPNNPSDAVGSYVVADATPLHYLILIGEVEILRELYGTIAVPSAVLSELSAFRTPPEVRAWVASLPSWIQPLPGAEPSSLPFPTLGLGERQAIASARESAGNVLLTDDLQAREAAESLGIQVVPTIRILSTAAALSIVDFEAAIIRLRLTNFRVSQKVIDRIRKAHSVKSG
jgi:predicted nucleic acid-binding protein